MKFVLSLLLASSMHIIANEHNSSLRKRREMDSSSVVHDIRNEVTHSDESPATMMIDEQDRDLQVDVRDSHGTNSIDNSQNFFIFGAGDQTDLTNYFHLDTSGKVEKDNDDGDSISDSKEELDYCLTLADKYEFYDWNELPSGISMALTTLEFNETIWNNDRKAPSWGEDWEEDLTENQQEAANMLKFTEETWGSTNSDRMIEWRNQFDCLTVVDKYDFYDWDDLPVYLRNAFMFLGYNENTWTMDGISREGTGDVNDWDYLTKEQQDAAKILGYTQKTWDGDK